MLKSANNIVFFTKVCTCRVLRTFVSAFVVTVPKSLLLYKLNETWGCPRIVLYKLHSIFDHIAKRDENAVSAGTYSTKHLNVV